MSRTRAAIALLGALAPAWSGRLPDSGDDVIVVRATRGYAGLRRISAEHRAALVS